MEWPRPYPHPYPHPHMPHRIYLTWHPINIPIPIRIHNRIHISQGPHLRLRTPYSTGHMPQSRPTCHIQEWHVHPCIWLTGGQEWHASWYIWVFHVSWYIWVFLPTCQSDASESVLSLTSINDFLKCWCVICVCCRRVEPWGVTLFRGEVWEIQGQGHPHEAAAGIPCHAGLYRYMYHIDCT